MDLNYHSLGLQDMRHTHVQRRSVNEAGVIATLMESVSTGAGDRPFSGESTSQVSASLISTLLWASFRYTMTQNPATGTIQVCAVPYGVSQLI